MGNYTSQVNRVIPMRSKMKLIGEESDAVGDMNISTAVVPSQKLETRSKRVNLLITPSVYENTRRKCHLMGISMNECINQLLSAWSSN